MTRAWMLTLLAAAVGFGPLKAVAQDAASLQPAVLEYVAVDASVVALRHVRLIDGSGEPAADDQTIVILGGKIQEVGPVTRVEIPGGAEVLDLRGHTVTPGFIGLHNHMYYGIGDGRFGPALFTFPRLYLAGGVTTIRTTGSFHPYYDLQVKAEIESGEVPGPKMHVTGPYLQGRGPDTRIHFLEGPEHARRVVAYWAEEGVTWFKAYTQVTRAELATAIDEAHRHGIKVTAHLCSVGFREAVALGIDNLEHGLLANTEFYPAKEPDICPAMYRTDRVGMYADLDMESEPVQRTIRKMVDHGVALTSTLAPYEGRVPGRPPLEERDLEVRSPHARAAHLEQRGQRQAANNGEIAERVMRKAMEFERRFVEAGGLLAAGSDPVGSVVPGFGDQRNFELLVEAGFTPEKAVRIMSANGARVLGIIDEVGTVEAGKQADLVVIRGDPARDPSEIRNVVLVFKDGVGYDSALLIASVRGLVGIR